MYWKYVRVPRCWTPSKEVKTQDPRHDHGRKTGVEKGNDNDVIRFWSRVLGRRSRRVPHQSTRRARRAGHRQQR